MVEKYEHLYFRVDYSSDIGVRGKRYGSNMAFTIDNITMTIRNAFMYKGDKKNIKPGIAIYFESDHALVHRIYWNENYDDIFDYFPELADTIDFKELSLEFIFAYLDTKPRKRKSNHS